jgi:hypothetical protein
MHMEYEPYRSGDWLINHENKEPAKRKWKITKLEIIMKLKL